MESKVMYRLPGANSCLCLRQTQSEPEWLSAIEDLSEREGFVFAPFSPAADTPIILIHPDVTEERPLLTDETPTTEDDGTGHEATAGRANYSDRFAVFRRSMEKGEFLKIVLARSAQHDLAGTVDEEDCERLFFRACQANPHSFVAMVSTPLSGTWLIATPEPLLQYDGTLWHTAAFDCTRSADDLDYGWNDAELYQQRMMTNYFVKIITPLADNIRENGPDTVIVNHLAHIATDLSFTLKDGVGVGTLLSALHPTPAVCGQPKAKAYAFILANEGTPRDYFSGFLGPMTSSQTHLFVTLRCMRLHDDKARLYAGGGILADSDEQVEWDDTQMKMQVMRELL